jgi:SPP1 gp7 family putative phage head morphogenesis protein
MPKIPAGTRVRDLTQEAQRSTAPASAAPTSRDRRGNLGILVDRDFGPGVPLTPRSAPGSPEQTQGPRQWQYWLGQNTITTPRREQPGLTPFEQLRNLAGLYDVAAIAIAVRIEELQGMTRSVVSVDKRQQAARQGDCDALMDWWQFPDGLNHFDAWLGSLLYDMFSIDAMTLYLHPDRGGRLSLAELVDGATIKPLLDDRGRTLAYQQILYGYPYSEYRRPGTDQPDEDFPTFGREELLYLPRWTRSWTPYGFPPSEWIILRVNQALRKQAFDLAYFTDGNIPEAFASPPEGMLNPDQVLSFEENFNAILQGNVQAHRRVHFLPWRMDVKEFRSFSYQTELDYWLLRIACAAYGTPPTEIGFTDNANRSTSEMQEAINERRGLKPLTRFLTASIFNPISWRLGQSPDQVNAPAISVPGAPTRPVRGQFDGLTWQWEFGETDDALSKAQEYQIDLQEGVISADEVRTLKYGNVLTGPAPGKPSTLPLSAVEQLKKKAAAPEPDWEAREKRERQAKKVFGDAYEAQAGRVTDALEQAEPGALEGALTTIMAAEAAALTQAVLPFFDAVTRQAAVEGLGQLAIGVEWDIVNEAALKLASERAARFALESTGTSQQLAAGIIKDWIKTGGTLPDLIRRVRHVWSGPRADVAAVTEVTNLFAEGNLAAWRASRVVKGYRFHTARDSKVCPICAPLDGQTFALDDSGHRPALHARCRCAISPVVG